MIIPGYFTYNPYTGHSKDCAKDNYDHTRWYWKDTTIEHNKNEFISLKLKQNPKILTILCVFCTLYMKAVLPDTYILLL